MNWCRIIGHKWQYYHEDVPHITPAVNNGHMSVPSLRFMVDTEFRFCAKCFTNQIRVAHSGDEQVDWRNCELMVDQLRQKKLNDLGI